MFVAVVTALFWFAAWWTNNWLYVGINCTSYSFAAGGSGAGVQHFVLPANSCGAGGGGGSGGGIIVTGLTSHLGGLGFTFSVVIDGGAPIVTPCLNGSSQTIPIPAGTTTVDVTVTTGCAGGSGGSYTITVSG